MQHGRCGRCKGRRTVKILNGFDLIPCPDCGATGIKQPKQGLASRPGPEPGERRIPIGPCVFCGQPGTERHHVIAVQRLRRYVPAEGLNRAIRDLRNQVDVDRPCHEAIENGRIRVEEEYLPLDFQGYVEEYDLFAALPRHLQETA